MCDECMLSLSAKWLGIHLTRVHGPSSDQVGLNRRALHRPTADRMRIAFSNIVYTDQVGLNRRALHRPTADRMRIAFSNIVYINYNISCGPPAIIAYSINYYRYF